MLRGATLAFNPTAFMVTRRLDTDYHCDLRPSNPAELTECNEVWKLLTKPPRVGSQHSLTKSLRHSRGEVPLKVIVHARWWEK